MENISLDFETTAVVLIDMQDTFIRRNPPRILPIIPNQLALFQFCKKNNVKTFIIEMNGYESTVKILSDIVSTFPTSCIYKIKKSYDGAFNTTDLDQLLIEAGITTIILTGINANACVLKTIEEGQQKYRMITSKDLIASTSTDTDYEIVYRRYEFLGVTITENHETLLQLFRQRHTAPPPNNRPFFFRLWDYFTRPNYLSKK